MTWQTRWESRVSRRDRCVETFHTEAVFYVLRFDIQAVSVMVAVSKLVP